MKATVSLKVYNFVYGDKFPTEHNIVSDVEYTV